jgi:hypothetical protein
VWSRLCGRSRAGAAKPGSPGQIRSGGRGQLAIRVLDLPIHNPQVLLRVGPNDLVAGDPAGLLGRRVDLEPAGQAAPERKLLGLAPTPSGPKVVQRGSRRPLGKRFRWWARQDLNLGTSSLSEICAWACFPRIVPATWANDAPLETATNRSAPMGCGPNVDQARPARGGSGAPRRGPWLARETPAGCPRQASPTGAIALLGEPWRGLGQRHPPV